MKKLFTTALCSLVVFAGFAQLNLGTKSVLPYKPGYNQVPTTTVPGGVNKFKQTGNRADTLAFALDYGTVDALYADANGFDFYYIGDATINSRYKNTDNFTLRYAAAIFDSLILIDGQNNTTSFLPRAKTQMNLDSFDVFFIHERANGNTTPDTITISVFNRNSLSITGQGPTATLNTTSLWDTTIITSTQLPVNVNNVFSALTFYPNLSFAKGETFGVRVGVSGDTANKVNLAAGFRDECAGSCVAEATVAGFNSLYYFNFTTQTGTNISGINSVGLDCDADGTVGTPGACEEFYFQNWYIFPYVTAVVDYGVAITADSLRACPGAPITLTANAFGSNSPTFTYSWASSSGTLTSTTDQQVTLLLGSGNAVVTVTVTDGDGATATATVTVQSNGININLVGGAGPVTINCGASTNITAQISGVTTGRVYTWSTGATGANAASISVNKPGNYVVTVTNSAGCSATASQTIQYPNGINNNLNFTVPSGQKCVNQTLTFINTSSNTNGWDFTWDYGVQGAIGFSTDGSYAYTAPGVYQVKVEGDSAGCKFVSPTKQVQVSVCIGVNDVAFEEGVNIMPNPSNGNVMLSVANAEKSVSVKVYNVIGSELRSFNFNDVNASFTKSLDLSELPTGTYLVKIQSADKTAVKRISINR